MLLSYNFISYSVPYLSLIKFLWTLVASYVEVPGVKPEPEQKYQAVVGYVGSGVKVKRVYCLAYPSKIALAVLEDITLEYISVELISRVAVVTSWKNYLLGFVNSLLISFLNDKSSLFKGMLFYY